MRGNFNSGKRFERVFGANPGVAAGSTDVSGDTVDMQDFRSLSTIIVLGAVAGTSELKYQERALETDSWEDVADSEVAVAADDGNQVIIMSYERTDKRYVRLVWDRDGSNNQEIAGAVYISGLTRDTLIAQPADVHSVNQVEG